MLVHIERGYGSLSTVSLLSHTPPPLYCPHGPPLCLCLIKSPCLVVRQLTRARSEPSRRHRALKHANIAISVGCTSPPDLVKEYCPGQLSSQPETRHTQLKATNARKPPRDAEHNFIPHDMQLARNADHPKTPSAGTQPMKGLQH